MRYNQEIQYNISFVNRFLLPNLVLQLFPISPIYKLPHQYIKAFIRYVQSIYTCWHAQYWRDVCNGASAKGPHNDTAFTIIKCSLPSSLLHKLRILCEHGCDGCTRWRARGLHGNVTGKYGLRVPFITIQTTWQIYTHCPLEDASFNQDRQGIILCNQIKLDEINILRTYYAQRRPSPYGVQIISVTGISASRSKCLFLLLNNFDTHS